MSEGSRSFLSRLVGKVLPRVPDFYGLINEQCDLLASTTQALVEFMETGQAEKALTVREMEHQGDDLKRRNIEVLSRAFATPMDREDIYRAIDSIDVVVNYAKTTVREMEVFGVSPDPHMIEICHLIRNGAVALRRGYGKLSTAPGEVEQDVIIVLKSERSVEKVYRRALANLFSADEQLDRLRRNCEGAGAEAFQYVMNALKRREVYRHLSNSADHMARAGTILNDIVVQIA
ncbi:MAG: DUF47 family protein [Candidatus Schekmanbacteria bacterium]|nr:DUF47 family protein [Candidatus Schekmanbacteria bacterium]